MSMSVPENVASDDGNRKAPRCEVVKMLDEGMSGRKRSREEERSGKLQRGSEIG